jgi:NAD(P)-dependent dehydrogenase (short-subunit alcohol dehydrogenase family)
MPRPLEEATVVITGASSGIGRAAALRFARRGSSLAICARWLPALKEAERECEAAGATVLARSVDVGDEIAVETFAAEAERRFGRIDVWVNNAGVIAYGEFLEIPPEVFSKVLETNLIGQVNGARSAMRRFRKQRAGVLINMSSVWGRVSTPQVSPYIVSKNAVRAFSECLRGEIPAGTDIHVTTLAPQAVDTPIFDHGANYTGRRIRPIPPVLSPDEVAAGIEACAEQPKGEVNYGRSGRLLEALNAIAPALYRRLAHPAFGRGSLGMARVESSSGNVLTPAEPHTIGGFWRSRRRGSLRRAFLAAAAGGIAGLAGAGSTTKGGT